MGRAAGVIPQLTSEGPGATGHCSCFASGPQAGAVVTTLPFPSRLAVGTEVGKYAIF